MANSVFTFRPLPDNRAIIDKISAQTGWDKSRTANFLLRVARKTIEDNCRASIEAKQIIESAALAKGVKP